MSRFDPYQLNSNTLEFYPDGSKYITSPYGTIYNKDMTYQANLSLPKADGRGLRFTTFVINQNERRIYAGCQNKNIEIYSTDNYEHIKTIKTKTSPYKLVDLGNQLLSISSANITECTNCPAPTGLVIQRFNK